MKFRILSLKILSVLLLFTSCSKEEEDFISQNCETDCTEIIGKIMTDNGTVPIADVELTVKWDNIPYLGSGTIRNKAITRTDSEGNFNLKFYIRDDEIEAGGFRIEYELNENEYLSSHLNRITIFQIARDTTININYNIPKKAFLNLSLLNLDDIQSGDDLATDFSYERPDGFDQSVDGQVISWSNESEQNNLIEVAGNVPVELRIRRRINGVSTSEIETLFLEAGTTSDYTIDFNN
ncbi:hypothetical protein [Mesoflavibacter zeaxanthinifaciens]|uniref:hypothetical protein n=1 Tax=Mesoflavibacter zeaxanthinifaciens TaxID=393060 RepID=UPI003A95B4A4